LYGALPLRHEGFFPGFEPGTFIPKSHFIDRPLNHYTTASIQRISLK
jgi:hypothetical protein